MCDFDPPTFYSEAWRQGRKPHPCVECCAWIQTGTLHRVATGCWDGQVSSHRFCARCAAIRDYVGALDLDGESGHWALPVKAAMPSK